MNREIITFDPRAFLPSVRAAFKSANGFKDGNEKHQRMEELGEQVLEDSMANLQLRAVVSAFAPDVLQDDTICIDDFSFHCPAFAQFDSRHIKRIYAFMLTVGEPKTTLEGITAAVFADMWATIFCDAMAEALAEMFHAPVILYPGFHGLELSNVPQFAKLLDAQSIGIRVQEPGCIMLPVKSSCGFMFETLDALPLAESKCEDCIGNKHWCIMCKKNEAKMQNKKIRIIS